MPNWLQRKSISTLTGYKEVPVTAQMDAHVHASSWHLLLSPSPHMAVSWQVGNTGAWRGICRTWVRDNCAPPGQSGGSGVSRRSVQKQHQVGAAHGRCTMFRSKFALCACLPLCVKATCVHVDPFLIILRLDELPWLSKHWDMNLHWLHHVWFVTCFHCHFWT